MKIIIILMLSLIIVISGCSAPNSGKDQSNLGTTKNNLESDQQGKGEQGSGEKSGTGCSNINECKEGCCKPVCEQTTKEFCEQSTGGPWLAGSCDQVKECKKSCCKPDCVELTELVCTQRGGTSTGKSCSDDEDCKKGCCTPFCAEATKPECGKEVGYGGVWHEEKCKDVEECNKICCSIDKTFITREECYQQNGNEIDNNQCAGKGTITVEVPHILSCDCGGGAEGVACTEGMNLVQKFTATFSPDQDVKSNNAISQWITSEKNYYYKGTGTYVMSGSGENTKTISSSVTCYGAGVPPNTKAITTTITSSDFTYSGSNTAEVKATLTIKDNGNYSLSFEYPSMNGKEKEIWSRKSESGCPGATPSAETETYDQDIEGAIVMGSIDDVKTLSGSQTFKQFPPEDAFACENQGNEGTGTITWNFQIPK